MPWSIPSFILRLWTMIVRGVTTALSPAPWISDCGSLPSLLEPGYHFSGPTPASQTIFLSLCCWDCAVTVLSLTSWVLGQGFYDSLLGLPLTSKDMVLNHHSQGHIATALSQPSQVPTNGFNWPLLELYCSYLVTSPWGQNWDTDPPSAGCVTSVPWARPVLYLVILKLMPLLGHPTPVSWSLSNKPLCPRYWFHRDLHTDTVDTCATAMYLYYRTHGLW